MKVSTKLLLLTAFVVLGIWFKYIFYIMGAFYIIAKVIYLLLDFLPDLFKLAIMIGISIHSFYSFFNLDTLRYDGFRVILSSYILYPILVISIWIVYFDLEANTGFREWVLNIPFSIFDYIVVHPYISIFGLSIIILIISVNKFPSNSSSSSSSSSSNYDYQESSSFSPSESRAFEQAEHIKKVRRELRR